MRKHILFFHGGGSQEDYDADAKLVKSLQSELGSGYSITYPFLPEEAEPDLGRRKQLKRAIDDSPEPVIVAGHSFGASMVLNHFSENKVNRNVTGIFLMATPFWSGDADWVQHFKLVPDFARKLDKTIPLYFYHCADDEEVPFEQFNVYRKEIPWATFRELPTGGHQFNNDMTMVANDIREVEKLSRR